MTNSFQFLIIDGYPKPSRDQFHTVGMELAGQLYGNMLDQHLEKVQYDILYLSDPDVVPPDKKALKSYDGIIWPGCNLTIYHTDDERVTKMVELAQKCFEAGIPQFGSCWGAQIAVYAAGGKIEPNPKGKEMGVARKIRLTEEGRKHPMYEGKPSVFDGFISHDDHITELPPGAKRLATNDFTRTQAVSVEYLNGTFWATQYHPEYNLFEMARLIMAREEKLIELGFFKNHEDMTQFVEKLDTIHRNPERKDLRWQLAIDKDLLTESIVQCEFVNWLNNMVIPTSEGT